MKSQKLKFSILILASFLVFCFGSTCYAWGYILMYDPIFSNGTVFSTYYSTSDSVDCWRFDLATMSYDDINLSNFASAPSSSNYASFDTYFHSLQSSMNIFSQLDYWVANGDDREYPTIDLSHCHHVFFSSNNTSSYFTYYIYSTTSSNYIAFIDDYLVSDSPFNIYQTSNDVAYGNSYEQNVISANGFYMCDISDFVYLSNSSFICSDLPIYLSSSSGDTGFTNINYNSTDFSFSNDNHNFNYTLTDGSIIDPNAPQPPAPDPYENDKYYLNFADTSYYTGGAITSFFHQNNFTFNEYVLLNPTNYRIKFEYVAHIKRGGNTYNFTYHPDDIQLAYFLGQSKRFSVGNRLIVPLSSDWFLDPNNHTMSSYLKGTVYDVQGTTSNFSNPNDVLQSDNEIVLDPIFIFRSDEYIEKQLPKLKSAYSFEQFTIDGYVTLYTANDSNYESYVYHDFYDWISGTSSLVDSPNTVPPYSAETPNDTNLPVNQSSGNSNNYASGSVNPTINVNVNAGSNNVPWTPYTLDQISYANVREMFADIKDFVDSTSSNSFWAVLQRVFGYIPQQIWNYIIISVAVICGFSVVRYVLRR